MARGFATTRWSLVLAAGDSPAAVRARALAELCEMYWYPLYAFARRDNRSRTHDDAADLTQGFIADLLSRNDLADVDPRKGKFRSWLLQSMRNFIARDANSRHA